MSAAYVKVDDVEAQGGPNDGRRAIRLAIGEVQGGETWIVLDPRPARELAKDLADAADRVEAARP